MANVRGIALDAAAAIVERLIGTAPPRTPRLRPRSTTRSRARGETSMFEAEFWVAVAFVIFVGILILVGVPKQRDRGARRRAKRASRPNSTKRAA